MDSVLFACPIRMHSFSIKWLGDLLKGRNLVTNCQSLK